MTVASLDTARQAKVKAVPNGFLSLDHAFVRSPRIVALSANGKALLLAIADRYNGQNNGGIPYSISEAMAWLHCSRSTAIRALQELQDAALIECTAKGSHIHKAGERKGTASLWRLTFKPHKGSR